jgi:hypothetical protein
MLKAALACLICINLCSCVIITREQAQQLDNTAYLLERRAELNDTAKQHLGENSGDSDSVRRIMDQNSQLNRNAAETIRLITGSSEANR